MQLYGLTLAFVTAKIQVDTSRWSNHGGVSQKVGLPLEREPRTSNRMNYEGSQRHENVATDDSRTADEQLACYVCGQGSIDTTVMVNGVRLCYSCRVVYR